MNPLPKLPPVASRTTRPSPDRVTGVMRPAPARNALAAQEDRDLWRTLALILGAVAVVLTLIFVTLNGIARALDRPEACRGLTAPECTAKLQEGAL